MHVALILHESPANRRAGVELYTLALAKELQSSGHTVTCIHPAPAPNATLGEAEINDVEGIPFTAFSVPIKQDLTARFMDDEIGTALAQYLQSLNVDVVHFHHLIGFTGSAIPACKTAGIPTIMTVHDSWYSCNQCHLVRYDGHLCANGPDSPGICATCLLERIPQLQNIFPHPFVEKVMDMRAKFLPKALSYANKLLANSFYTRTNMITAGIDEEKILLAPLGIPAFTPLPRTQRTGPLRVGYLGNIQFKKGVDVLLEAVRQLPEKEISLSIHGGILQPDYANALDLGNYYAGPYSKEDIPSILSQLDVLCAPSREESFGMIVREAYLAGIPVIASDIPAFGEIVEHGLNGMLFQAGKALELAACLKQCIDAPELLQSFSSNIPEIRTVPQDALKLTKLYKSL